MPNGERTAVLTYNGGPRPGIYRFERGQLAEMDRVAVPAPAPLPVKKKSAKSQKKNDQTLAASLVPGLSIVAQWQAPASCEAGAMFRAVSWINSSG